MTYAVRVTEDYVGLMGRHVVEGQMIIPGIPLVDVMTPEGVVKTIMSEGWGIVAHVEGEHIFSNPDEDSPLTALERDGEEDDEDEDGEEGGSARRGGSGGKGIVFYKGDVICHIVPREQQGTKKTGLHPRRAPAVRLRRLLGYGVT